jgi:ABC-type glycerol-3-phosphate transport system substrate-binding protein
MLANFYPNLLEIGNVDGSQWVLPLSAIPVDYYYRKDILDEAGLAPGDTWDDVLAIAQATQTDDRYGFAVRGERGNPITWTWLPMLWSFGGEIFDANGAAAYNSEAGVASVEFFKQLNATSAPGWLSAQDVAALLQQDQATQTTLMSVYNGAMDDPDASTVVGLVEFGEMPMKEKRATILGMWTIGIGARSANKDHAWRFVEFLSRPDIATQMALAGVVGATQPAIYQLPDAPRYFPTLGKVLEYASPPPLIPQAEEWFLITGTELQNALSDVKTPRQAMDDAAQQVNDLLAAARGGRLV